ncbi:MAG: DNA repair protein RecO [Planctomycetes bacterium]|nr:DNA repair protein RecO [Planctomycetota bacterium]
MPLVRDEAFCIRVWDWSETSQTVSLFARNTGVVRCVAKGAKRENSAFSGGLEALTRGEMIVSLKPGDTLSLLTSWDLLETFPAARRTLSAFHAAMALLDIIQRCIRDQDPHPGLFDSLTAAARMLGTTHSDREAVLNLLWSALVETGHLPELSRDVRADGALAEAAVYAFIPGLGGFSRDAAASTANPEEVWRVRQETLIQLRRLAGGETTSADEATMTRAVRFLASYFSWVFEGDQSALNRFVETLRT